MEIKKNAPLRSPLVYIIYVFVHLTHHTIEVALVNGKIFLGGRGEGIGQDPEVSSSIGHIPILKYIP